MSCSCEAFRSPLRNLEDIVERSKHSTEIEKSLSTVAIDTSGWRRVLRCDACGTCWVKEYPFSESHGGGAPCLYQNEIDDPTDWLRSSAELTFEIRQNHEDAKFLRQIGEEIGPKECTEIGCARLRVKNSVFCRNHHFESVTGKQSPNLRV